MKKDLTVPKFKLKFNPTVINILILLSFVIISIVSLLGILTSRTIFGAWDLQFHMRRLLELSQNVKHGFWLATPSFNYFHGALDMVMYPDLNVYLMLLIMKLIHVKVMVIGIFLIVSTFISLTIGYYSSYSVYHLRKVSYLFTIIYTLSSYLLALYLSNFDIGTITAYTLLPLVIFGFINFLKRSHWIGLSTGMSLIILNHLLSVIIITIFLLIWLIINFHLINKQRVKNLIKAVTLTVMATSFFWVPFLYYTILNHGQIFIPDTTKRMFGYNAQFFTGAFHLSPTYFSLSIFCLIAVMIGGFTYRHFDRTTKQLYVLSLVIIVGCSQWFPGGLVERYVPFCNDIQNLRRLYVIPQVALSFIFALVIIRYIKWRRSLLCAFIILTLGMFLKGEQIALHNDNVRHPALTAQMIQRTPTLSTSKPQNYKIMNYDQLKRLCQWPSYKADYYPEQVANNNSLVSDVSKNQAQSGKQTFNVIRNGYNRFTFQTPHHVPRLRLPLFKFTGEHLSITVDHHLVQAINDHNQITLRHVKRGRHILIIHMYHDYGFEYTVCILTLLSGFVYLIYAIRHS